jgi:response regulator of citrate/malate metabolism
MTGDELERAIEFLLKNQAAFEARQAALDARFEAAREQTNQQISELTVLQQATQRQLDHLTNVVASIAETTRRNPEDIDALVKLVGRLVEGRNGKPGS